MRGVYGEAGMARLFPLTDVELDDRAPYIKSISVNILHLESCTLSRTNKLALRFGRTVDCGRCRGTVKEGLLPPLVGPFDLTSSRRLEEDLGFIEAGGVTEVWGKDASGVVEAVVAALGDSDPAFPFSPFNSLLTLPSSNSVLLGFAV